jgi:hypothetical protein
MVGLVFPHGRELLPPPQLATDIVSTISIRVTVRR